MITDPEPPILYWKKLRNSRQCSCESQRSRHHHRYRRQRKRLSHRENRELASGATRTSGNHQHRRWLNLPHIRFNKTNPAEHFYLHAIRFENMFAQLVIPLRDRGSLRIEMDYAEETATKYRKQVCEFEDINLILMAGIYLLKRPFPRYCDLAFWIDCSFETALERAITRAQEALPPEDTIKAYRTIYFPAQEIHFSRDNPQSAATAIINNDPRLHLDPRDLNFDG